MSGRHTGIVTHLDVDSDHGEITAPGMGPHSCTASELRRIGADKLGVAVEFEFGALAGGNSGAVRLSLGGMPR